MQAIRRNDPELARSWRYHTRDVFERLFADGYLIMIFVSYHDRDDHSRSYYLLAHRDG
ncbi:MAG: hypothetical protein R3C44_03490 [Chloroflexota bacterium]